MRKVLSFVLVLALVLGSFSMAFAATPTDVVGTPSEEAVTVLSGLGVVTGYPDGSFKPANIVTRAEMAKLVVVALGLGEYATSTTTAFPDMAGATWAQGYVAYATGLGIIKGYPDGTFKPSQTVSYPEAATMIVRALGYTDASLLPATWPANYMVKAKALGILDDIGSTIGGANRGDIAIMIYNALSLNIGSIDNDSGKWIANSTVEPFDRMITRLSASADTITVAPGDVGDADVSLVDLAPYVYATLHVYKNSDDVIVSIASVHSDSLVGEITTGAGLDAKSTITLANDDVVTLAGITSASSVYFNGGADTYATNVQNFLDGYDVTVYGTLNADEDSFTTVSGIIAWAPTAVYQAAKADVTDISDALIDGNGVVFDVTLPTVDGDGEALDLAKISVVGAATKLADIKADDVVYVYAAADAAAPTQVKFEVVRNTKDITITKVSSTKIYDGATAYAFGSVNSGVAGDTFATISGKDVGDSYTLYLGNDGKIAYVDSIQATPDNYGVITGMSRAVVGTFSTTYKLQMLTADNDFVVFELDDTVAGLTNAAVLATTGTGISYSVDSDGLITSIGGITTDLVGTYSSRSNSLAGKFVASNVVVFDATTTYTSVGGATVIATYPTDDWTTTNLGDQDVFATVIFDGGSATNSAFYVLNDDGDIAAIVYHDIALGSSSANYFAVNAIGEVQNSSDDLVLEITGFKGGVANTSLSTHAILPGSLPTVPVVWSVTYTGIAVSSYSAIAAPTILVVDASDTFLSTTSGATTVNDVATDVIVYVQVYDADGALDSYKIGSMNDVTVGDKVSFVNDATDGIKLIVLRQRADI